MYQLKKSILTILLLSHINAVSGLDDATLDFWILGDEPEIAVKLWETEFNFRLGTGYNDNVLLSPFGTQEGGLLKTDLEIFSWRLPEKNKADIYWYLIGENVYYPDIDTVENERLIILQYKLDKPTSPKLRLGTTLQYIYSDQVFEVGFSELDTEQSILESNQFAIRPFISHSLSPEKMLQLELPVKRNFFRDSIDDYTEPAIKFLYSQKYGFSSKLKSSYEFGRRYNDNKPIKDEDGFSLEGTKVNWKWHRLSCEIKHNWNEKKSLRTKSKLSIRFNEDNGQGYDDFTRYRLSQRIGYELNRWMISATVNISYYRYSVQPADLLNILDQSKRKRTEFNTNMHIERTVSEKIKLILEFIHKENDSTRSTEEYFMNAVTIGIDMGI